MKSWKKAIKKIALIAGAGAMIGATLAGAMAVNSPVEKFLDKAIVDGSINAYVVVGANAATADVVGAVDITAAFAQMATTTETVEVPGAVVSGGEDYETEFEGHPNFETYLKDDDLAGFKDTSLTFRGETYDYEEVLEVDNTKISVKTSGYDDEEYGADPAVELNKDALKYYIHFKDDFNWSKVDNDHPLTLEIAGTKIEIVKNLTTDSIKARIAEKFMLGVGDTATVDGHTITIDNIGSDSVAITVDGDSAIVDKGNTAELGGIVVEVSKILYEDNPEGRLVIIYAGDKTTDDYKDGDAFIGEDKDNPTWKWYIDLNNDKIGVKLAKTIDDPEDGTLMPGDSLNGPNNYFGIKNAGKTITELGEYDIYYDDGVDLSKMNITGWTSSEPVIVIESKDDSEGIAVGTSYVDYVDKVYLYAWNNSGNQTVSVIADIDDDGELEIDKNVTSSSTDKSLVKLTYNGNSEIWVNASFASDVDIVIDTPKDDITINTSVNTTTLKFTGLGNPEDAEDTDIKLGSTKVGERDYDVLTKYGIVIQKPSSTTDNDKVILMVPEEQVKDTVVIFGPQTTTAEAGTVTTTVVHYVDATTGLARLDTEVPSPDKPVILVGGPNANALVAELSTYLEGLNMTEGKAVIKYIENAFGDNPALIVAGYTADDTRFASKVVAYKMIHSDAYPEMDDSTTVIVTTTGADVSSATVEKVE